MAQELKTLHLGVLIAVESTISLNRKQEKSEYFQRRLQVSWNPSCLLPKPEHSAFRQYFSISRLTRQLGAFHTEIAATVHARTSIPRMISKPECSAFRRYSISLNTSIDTKPSSYTGAKRDQNTTLEGTYKVWGGGTNGDTSRGRGL